MSDLGRFSSVWVEDFEFYGGDGENPVPVCFVAWELRSGQRIRLWRDEFPQQSPLDTSPQTLHVAFYSSAEWNCYLSLGWRLPAAVVDLYAEFRALTNNRMLISGNSLLGALVHFGLSGITSEQKEDMRALIMTGGPWTLQQQRDIVDYCWTDVDATARLWGVMAHRLDMPRALLRGRYMEAVARIETVGVPIDTGTLGELREEWRNIQGRLIAEVDQDYGVFDGAIFKLDRFERWLVQRDIPWPVLESGRLDLQDETFREMARSYPAVAPLQQLRATLATMRPNSLAVGQDGRNRTLLSPFKSTTGRNQPSNAKSIFGPSRWLRGLVKPPPGYGVCYADWCQQEFGAAAALSGDAAMMAAYRSGDPYLEFARQSGMVPADATKQSHKAERDRAKACVLAVQYGMAEFSLAARINQTPAHASASTDLS